MSKQESIWYLSGMLITSVGIGLSYGLGQGITSLGILTVFLAVIGDWDD